MEAKCKHCSKSIMQVAGGFYQLHDGFICKEDYQSAPDQYSPLYDLFEDSVLRNFSSIGLILKSLEESGLYTQSVDWVYQQVMYGIVYRIWEMYTQCMKQLEEQQAASEVCPPEEEEPTETNWKCPHCDYENFPGNPICYKCRNAPNSENPVMPQTALDQSFLELMATYAFQTMSLFWTCIRCGNNNIPKTKHACDCGFVNLSLVSSEIPEPLPSSIPVVSYASLPNPCWKCSCGYEYNQKADKSCIKCSNPRPVESDSASIPVPKQPLIEESKDPLPEKGFHDPLLTCDTCGSNYNEAAGHMCKPEESYEPAEPSKCAKCGIRETSDQRDICEPCKSTVIVRAKTSNGKTTCSGCGGAIISGKDCQKCKKAQPKVQQASIPVPFKFWKCVCGRSIRAAKMTCDKCSLPRPQIFCIKNCGTAVDAIGNICQECLIKQQSSNQRKFGAASKSNK